MYGDHVPPVAERPATVADHLGALFGEAVCRDRQLVIFGIAGADRTTTSKWCTSIPGAVEAVEELGSRGEVYFGCSLQDPVAALNEARRRANESGRPEPQDMQGTRGYARSACAIGGIWLDVDVEGPGHKALNLPRTIGAAQELLKALPLRPTWTVATGGGLHAYWVFKEPWIFEDESERARAARLVHGWQVLARGEAQARGWTMDSTHDLARVLRPIGTINRKYGRRVEVVP